MKKILIAITIISAIFTSCKKEEIKPTQPTCYSFTGKVISKKCSDHYPTVPNFGYMIDYITVKNDCSGNTIEIDLFHDGIDCEKIQVGSTYTYTKTW